MADYHYMTLEELISKISDDTYVRVVDTFNGEILSEYDTKDSIDESFNKYEVNEVGIENMYSFHTGRCKPAICIGIIYEN